MLVVSRGGENFPPDRNKPGPKTDWASVVVAIIVLGVVGFIFYYLSQTTVQVRQIPRLEEVGAEPDPQPLQSIRHASDNADESEVKQGSESDAPPAASAGGSSEVSPKPSMIAHLYFNGVRDMDMQGSNVYLLDRDSRLHIIDVSDPSNPYEVTSHSFPVASAVTVNESLVYVAAGSDGLRIIDVSNVSSPQEISHVFLRDLANDVAVRDHFAFVANCFVGLLVLDVMDPASPKAVGLMDTQMCASGLKLSDSRVYLWEDSEFKDSLDVIDVSDPSKPVQTWRSVLDDVSGVAILHNQLLVSGSDGGFTGLKIYSLDGTSGLRQVGSFGTKWSATSVTANQTSLAYVTTGMAKSELHVLDWTDSNGLTDLAIYDLPVFCASETAGGSHVFLGCEDGLRIVDVSNVGSDDIEGGDVGG